jgi:hypothetical protein
VVPRLVQLSFGDAADEADYGVALHGSKQMVLGPGRGQMLKSKGNMDIFVAGAE